MIKKSIIFFVASLLGFSSQATDIRYVGGDISLYPTFQDANAQYKDQDGNKIDLLPYLHELGMNAMRVRLFVDPAAFEAKHPDDYDPNACQSLPYILPLCKDIIDNGFELMLDFHYSDTWADPAKQWIPDAWKDLSDEQLENKIYEYTKETLLTLQENGITPRFIQPGNEISYGMLWSGYGENPDANKTYTNSSEQSWKRFGILLSSAIKACREVCPDAEIIIHTERVGQVMVLTNFYDRMASLDIDYDIIGLSYYPYFHANMAVLNNVLTTLERHYPDKMIMIVETNFPYAWEVPGTDQKVDYEYSLAGQNEYAEALVNTLLKHDNVNGLFWWWLEYNAYGTSLKNWYNAPLFDSRTGRATPALKTIASYGSDDAGIEGIEDDFRPEDDRWFDLNGRPVANPDLPGLYIHNGKKVVK